jgi:hypothetical protein
MDHNELTLPNDHRTDGLNAYFFFQNWQKLTSDSESAHEIGLEKLFSNDLLLIIGVVKIVGASYGYMVDGGVSVSIVNHQY